MEGQNKQKDISKYLENLGSGALEFIVGKIQIWVKYQPRYLDLVRTYFCLSSKTIDLVNNSMTQLLYQNRKVNFYDSVGILTYLYYFACDLKHMVRDDLIDSPIDVNYVKSVFENVFKKL